VLNNISKFIPKTKLKIPAVGLLIAVGILGLGTIGQMTKIQLKSQVIAADLPDYTNNKIQGSHENALLSKLRDIRDHKSQVQSNSLESQNSFIEVLKSNIQEIPTTTKPSIKQSPVSFPVQDGVYLYGQSSTPNQWGQGYIVFQKHKGKVTGALYMPSSEFSCFQGTIAKSGELAMTVTSSPSETGIAQVSTASRIPRVTDETSITYAHSVALQDYHQLASVSINDKEILQACQQDLNADN
jgi:hypothetical protein